jgi:hypothetical protein
MPEVLQLPDGTKVFSNRFGNGPFQNCERFVNVVLPQGVEIEGISQEFHLILPIGSQRFACRRCLGYAPALT